MFATQDYKHLGGVTNAVGSVRTELGERVAAAHAARVPLASAFGKTDLSEHTRVSLVTSLLLPRLLRSEGAWPPLTPT